ncbi:MAG: DUF222 domain-containing protein [Tessaracoccus sp.]
METTQLNTAQGAAQRLHTADAARRRGEADTVLALCELAESYHLDETELHEILVDDEVRIAGTGTPLVSQYLSLEIAGLLGCTPRAAAMKLADALNLKYRHPQLFEAMQHLRIDTARALHAARRCADLHPMAAETATSRWLAKQHKLGWKAAFALLDKLIIQADPKLAKKKEQKAREDRGVWLWGLFEGAMNLTGKLDLLDARYLDTRLDEVASLIETQYPELTHAQRRAKAIGILANPAYATILLQHGQPTLLDRPRPHEPENHPVQNDAPASSDPADASRFDPHHYEQHHCGTVTVPPSQLRPKLGMAIHIHTDALGNLDIAARAEKAGHITTELLAELLGEGIGTNITVQPVIDLPILEAEDQYVPSTRMRRAVTLAFPTEMFPFSTLSSDKVDLDHTLTYRAGSEAQTRIGNLAPLGRRAHRAKTAGYWTLNQSSPGVLEWQSPLGYRYRVTTQGTTQLNPRAEANANDPPGSAA